MGLDDAAFTWEDASVPVVGVVMRGGAYVEGVVRTDVTVDGDDATARLVDLLAASRFTRDLEAVLLDGVAFGGFNVVDVEALHAAVRVPVVTVTRGVPDLAAMRAALESHHADWERKWRLVARVPTREVPTAGTPLTLGVAGTTFEHAVEVVARSTVRGLTPEPLRLAHLVAAGVFGARGLER